MDEPVVRDNPFPFRAAWILPALLGVGLGINASLADRIFPMWVGNMGALWAVAGMLSAALWGDPAVRARMQRACVCLGTATVVYYFWRIAIEDSLTFGALWRRAPFWFLLAMITGLGVGLFSVTLRSGLAAVAGAFIGEAAAVAVSSGRWEQVIVEAIIGIGLLAALNTGERDARNITIAAIAAIGFGLASFGYRALI